MLRLIQTIFKGCGQSARCRNFEMFFVVSSCSPVADQAVNLCSRIEPLVQNNLDFVFAALKSELHLLGGHLHVH
jgi:hypothetical protein